jgi:outer membrane protein assembly factor BamA
MKKAIVFLLYLLPLFCFAGKQGDETKIVIGRLVFKGNKITHENIMRREMEFKQGDTLSGSELISGIDQSRLNLLNTSLFNFVTIDTVSASEGGAVDIGITVVERWYTWIGVIAELADRNFNTWWETRDFTRINVGARVSRNNFRGRMEQLRFAFQVGRTQKLSMYYEMPYINRQKTAGLIFNAAYNRQREVGYITENDKYLYLKSEGILRSDLALTAHVRIRPNMMQSHTFGLEYNHFEFADSLLILNPAYSFSKQKIVSYFSLIYLFKADHRDIHYYPLNGWYFDILAYKSGFGILPGETGNLWYLNPTFRYYQPMSKRFFLSAGITGKVSSRADQPYFYQRGLGYGRDFVRGYEYYVVDGKHYIMLKTNLKFALFEPRNLQVGFIPSERFSKIHYAVYLNLFADGAYVSGLENTGETNNRLPDTFLRGLGFGVDVVTYYDKVVRFEYSMNKWGESGIFIHFIAGI